MTVPVLMIRGEKDQTFIDDILDLMSQYAGEFTIVRVPEAAHWTPMERPQKANDAVERFVAAVDP